MAFQPVSPQVNFPELEKQILDWWYSSGLVDRYLHKNDSSAKKFSFLDGPITANNPMGVHHAWGRTYKDLWQRYFTMRGYAGRYQNGFDCQGLWVEVEVEKELGFKTKKDIEVYGVAKFVEKCKERVLKYSAIQTEQSKRLGYFMDWDRSYFTMSDANNYAIWNFLQVVWNRGWLYKGHDSVPWCPRCETAISQHEMLTEDYKEITHDSVFIKFPLVDFPGESLLVWTTTPWTVPANIAVAVDPKLDYVLVSGLWVVREAAHRLFGDFNQQNTLPGKKLVGRRYIGPFDHLPAVQKVAEHKLFHTVIPTDARIMPINTEEGTGLVHTAVSAGEEDFKLGQKLGLPLIPVIADNADYLPGLGEFTGQNAKKHPEIILDYLKSHDFAYKVEKYTHRYPACWRCKTELVWKIADEWYISMDTPDPTDPGGLTLRKQLLAVAKKIHWLPGFGKDRELDWLKNMHDWLISKKNRYWGLALPIYECPACHHFEVIGSKEDLEHRAVSGWEEFAGNTPHKPWIDAVKIRCSRCSAVVSRIPDVGNPWLDAGIVSVSTLPAAWFPADFITESFPGQFKNWFYSLIVMSTVLKKTFPTKTILGYASVVGEDGRPMHKSWGNAVEFNEGAEQIGADVMRWMFVSQSPEANLPFGFRLADDTRRHFHLMLWNVYNFFLTYASLDGFDPAATPDPGSLSALDRWLNIRLSQTVKSVTAALDRYDSRSAALSLEQYVNDLSLWYVRRSRDRVGPTAANPVDKLACHTTLFTNLVTLSQLLAPFQPFISESIYKNLTGRESVHLSNWPKPAPMSTKNTQLISSMESVRRIVEMGLSQRKNLQIKVRQPLSGAVISSPSPALSPPLCDLIRDELNLKHLAWEKGPDLVVTLDPRLDDQLRAEGQARDLIRQIQEQRKIKGARLDQPIRLIAPLPPDPVLVREITRQTLAREVSIGSPVEVELL